MTKQDATQIGRPIATAASMLVLAQNDARRAGSPDIAGLICETYKAACAVLDALEREHPDCLDD